MRTMLQQCIAYLLCVLVSTGVLANQPLSIDELLDQVRQGKIQDNKTNTQRLAEFKNKKDQQAHILRELTEQKNTLEQRSKAIELSYEKNDEKLAELAVLRDQRLGALKELFGVIQQAAQETQGQLETSLTHVEFPEREAFLDGLVKKLSDSHGLATIEDVQGLQFEILREMAQSAKVVRYPASVINASGEKTEQQVTRVGLFNVVSRGHYLYYAPESNELIELSRQPGQRYQSTVKGLEQNQQGLSLFALDPSRGSLLSLLVNAPSLSERFHQGGVVGYLIVLLGSLALCIAVFKLIQLQRLGQAMRSQARALDAVSDNNPLGRVLAVFHANTQATTETLELKLGEAVIRELPPVNRWIPSIKIIAAVAPLLGLLGTVTGMIVTFQSITLFGTGDPKLMAGGISTALVTTVLGLICAIPALLLHSVVASKAQQLNQILEEQAMGLVANQSEHLHQHGLLEVEPPVNLKTA